MQGLISSLASPWAWVYLMGLMSPFWIINLSLCHFFKYDLEILIIYQIPIETLPLNFWCSLLKQKLTQMSPWTDVTILLPWWNIWFWWRWTLCWVMSPEARPWSCQFQIPFSEFFTFQITNLLSDTNIMLDLPVSGRCWR